MPYDAELVLRDGSVDLENSESVATSVDANDDGAKCVDLGWTTRPRGDAEGSMRLSAVLILPSAPTTYTDTLTVVIQQSDSLGFGWETIADFSTMYAFTRLVTIAVTTAFVAGDISKVLTGDSTGDTGEIRWMHPDLLIVGKTARAIVTMQGSDDVFDNATEGLTVAGGGAGIGTMSGVAIVEGRPQLGGPNTHIRSFDIRKRYIRGQLTASGSSNFGKASLFLTPYPFRRP